MSPASTSQRRLDSSPWVDCAVEAGGPPVSRRAPGRSGRPGEAGGARGVLALNRRPPSSPGGSPHLRRKVSSTCSTKAKSPSVAPLRRTCTYRTSGAGTPSSRMIMAARGSRR